MDIATQILMFGLRYGPEAATAIIALIKKKDITLDDVDAVFANVKPYSAYGIPDVDATGKPL